MAAKKDSASKSATDKKTVKGKAVKAKKAASKTAAAKKTPGKAASANTASAEKAAAKATSQKTAQKTTKKPTKKPTKKTTTKAGTKTATKSPAKKAKAKKSAATSKSAATTSKSPIKKKAVTSAKKPASESKTAPSKKTAASKAATEPTKTAAKATTKKAATKKATGGRKKAASKARGRSKAADAIVNTPIRKRSLVKKAPVKLLPRPTSHAKASADSPFKNYTPYDIKSDEEYMNPDQENHFRIILNNWRTELMEEVDRTVNHMKDEAANFPDPADRATQEEEFSIELRTRDRERKLIKKIDQTLERVEQQDYGFCDTCGVEIGLRRLEARPTATQCVDCKTLDELRERQLHG